MRFYQLSVADPGCPGSEFFPPRIPDPNIFHPGSASKNLSIFTPKMVSNLPDPDSLPIPDPGSRGHKGTGYRIQIRNTVSIYFSDILDLLKSSTTRKDEEEAVVVENVEEDSEDEVLVLEDTTGGQDGESAEVIIYVTVIRLCAGCGSGSA